MYLILICIVIISIGLWYFTTSEYLYLNAPPKSCPIGHRIQGNKCVPNATLIQNGLNYVTKNPQKKVPDAYKPLVDGGYLKKQGSQWTSNYSPSGQPPAFNNTGCPNGQRKDAKGKCVSTSGGMSSGGSSGSGGCPNGQIKDKNGKCVKAQGGGGEYTSPSSSRWFT